MSDVLTIEERIMRKFFEKMEADNSIPREVVRQIRLLWNEGKLKDADAILKAIREGVKDHAKGSAT
jgi:hypothetical protein